MIGRDLRAQGRNGAQSKSHNNSKAAKKSHGSILKSEMATRVMNPAAGTLSESARTGFENLRRTGSDQQSARMLSPHQCRKIAGMLQREKLLRGEREESLPFHAVKSLLWMARRIREHDWVSRSDALSFGDGNRLIWLNTAKRFLAATRPHNFQAGGLSRPWFA